MLKRLALIAAGIAGSVVLWTGGASAMFAWFGHVPLRCWFYYAVPWPDDFLWDGAYLMLSGALASLPFILAARVFVSRWRSAAPVYGKTDWATGRQRNKAGIVSARRPF